MKRRSFGALCSGSALAGVAGLGVDMAPAQAAPDASLLKTTLTPFGSIRAGNADGSIPAWTGGFTTLPEGFKPGDVIGDLFPDEKPVLTVDSSNVNQYADRLSEGMVQMINKYGFSVQVYPTHRTHGAPQKVYDCIAANVASAQPVPEGWRWGFVGAYGGIPFPILDPDPNVAGPQAVYNAVCNFKGFAYQMPLEGWSVSSGAKTLAFKGVGHERFPYYQANSLEEYNGLTYQFHIAYSAPAVLVGQELVVYSYTNAAKNPQIAWELLNGEGRVRRAPEISFDTPASQSDDIANTDEEFGFNGSLEKYDWKYLGTKEMYVPYNTNRMHTVGAEDWLLTHFVDPNLVRFERHRCRVVEATLHPGERSVDSRRVLYIDEDTSITVLVDNWDANGDLVKACFTYPFCRPDLPATIMTSCSIHNLQTGDYANLIGPWGPAEPNSINFLTDLPEDLFDPQEMAANAQY
jgi:hypothetical protein